MNLNFEHDYQQKVMTQEFTDPTYIDTAADIQLWRNQWMQALTSWHSPYKTLIDVSNLTLADNDEVTKNLEVMLKFFKGFFLRKAVGFGYAEAQGHERLPFPVKQTAEEAAEEAGIRTPKKREPGDFRSNIQLQNHFRQHTVELNFIDPVTVETEEQVTTLKGKLTNNLMQWHSKWNLLIDCSNMEVGPGLESAFERMFASLRGFFMKKVIGYSPKGPKESYPFDVFRSRHRAAALLEAEGAFSGDEADCRSRQG